MLAAHGVEVVGTDYNEELVRTLCRGDVTFKEKGLKRLLSDAVNRGIRFTTEYQTTDTYIVSVPTPYDEFSKQVDPRYVVSAVNQVLTVCKPGAVIVIESTVSPGTIDTYVRPLLKERIEADGCDIHLVHAPERILPGNMIHEMVHNNRTIGADSDEVARKVKKLYASFCLGKITTTDIRICNKHPRVSIMHPGPGVGGHCISVDPWFLVGSYPQLTRMIGASLEVNASQPRFVLRRIREIMEANGLTDISRVGLYGLTYKENVDDYRDSPSLQLLEMQKDCLATPLKSYDPYLEEKHLTEGQFSDFDAFLDAVDLVVVMVKHEHIKENWDKLKGKVILDCHNICPFTDRTYKL